MTNTLGPVGWQTCPDMALGVQVPSLTELGDGGTSGATGPS
jgi:hypothetical protein